VRLLVGDFTRRVRHGDEAFVSFALLQSRNAVIRVSTALDGVDMPPSLEGADLRRAAGMYFRVAETVPFGTHQLTVTASDGMCEDGSTRPLTIQVVP
jgi:hypothetical protein